MAERHGRRVPAHFGSTAAEEAVCLRGVGMADRSDRETFELRGTSEAVEQALVALGERAWCSFIAADRAIVRCEAEDPAGLRSPPSSDFPASQPTTARPSTPRSA